MKHPYLAAVAILFASSQMWAQTPKDSVELPEIVVTGVREATSARGLPVTVSVVDRKQLEQSHSTSVLPSVMQEVPGLLVTSRSLMGYGVSTGGAGGLSLRGLSGSSGQMLVLIDGQPQYNGIYGHPVADSYRALTTERVEILRGPASVLYGSNAMGGVMNIITRTPEQEGFRASLGAASGSFGTVQTDANVSFRKGKFSAIASAQANRTNNHRPNMGFKQYGGYLKLGYDISSHWNTFATLDLTHWNASNPGSIDDPKLENDQWITRGTASLVLENHYEKASGALSIYDNFGRHKINDGYSAFGGRPQTDFFRSEDALTGLSWYQNFRLLPGNSATVGIDAYHIYGHAWYTDRLTDTVVTTPRRLMQSANTHNNEVAGYIDVRQDIVSCLTLDLGIRYDHHTVAGGEWVPQAGLVWHLTSTGELKALVSKGFRNPNTREMYMYGTANHDSLRAERLWNYELSWRQHLQQFTYGANLYYIKGDNLIQAVAGRNINTGEIENYGLEFDATWHPTAHIDITTNHAFLHMKHEVIAAPRYKCFVGGKYHRNGWQANIGVQYIDGLCVSVGNNPKKESFCLVDASVGYTFNEISLWLRVDNLFNNDYQYVLGYPMPGTTLMSGLRWNLEPR